MINGALRDALEFYFCLNIQMFHDNLKEAKKYIVDKSTKLFYNKVDLSIKIRDFFKKIEYKGC